ncbi:hypothetical protein G6L00_06185 [Agrobacterium rhizogenes]|nr:hypothetical protein [Rhizobium rhizogenes]
MSDVNDFLTLTISVDFRGVEKSGEDEKPVHDFYEETFSITDEDAELTSTKLEEIAEAVMEGRLYGWLQQEKIDGEIQSGDLRPETAEEMLARVTLEHAKGS